MLRNPIFTEFPGGYNPDFGADLTDMSFVLGLKGDLTDTLTWDLSGRYAENEVEYTLSDTINPSLGGLSPLSFNPGTLTQEESGINLDFVQSFENSPLNVAFGAEFRNETYKIDAGDEASVVAGPTAAIFGVGSDGFQGFTPESAGSFESDSWAGYVDVETDLTDRLSGAIALRYEDYDEFGDTTDWKVSGRYQFTDAFAIRATANTGFRAPTPGQVNTLNVTTTSDSSGNLIPNGTYPVAHPVAVTLGAVPLEAGGIGGLHGGPGVGRRGTDQRHARFLPHRDRRPGGVAHQHDRPDRGRHPRPRPAYRSCGSPATAATRTSSSMDSTPRSKASISRSPAGSISAAATWSSTSGYNYNKQEVSNVTPGTINDARVFDLENQIPENRSMLSFNWDIGRHVRRAAALELLRQVEDDRRAVRSDARVRNPVLYLSTARLCSSTPRSA